MPELPEVETVVRTIRPRLQGRQIAGVVHLRSDIVRPIGMLLTDALVTRTICTITRRAKRIVLTLDDRNVLFIHLGMTGRLTVCDPATEIEKHTHFIAVLDDGRQLRFTDPRRFGKITWLGQTRENRKSIGPEPLTLSPARLHRQLQSTTRAIKTALLDQTRIAGIGNIYADEALHRAQIHPMRRACDLSIEECRSLNRAIKYVLQRAIRAGGSTLRDYVDANGQRGSYQQSHAVYARTDEPCPRCKTPIARIVLQARSTHFCPTCQPAST